jgi:hypothetical protein
MRSIRTDHRFGEFKANIERAGISDLVTPIASPSQPAADDFDEPIELLFVDGSHGTPGLEDFEVGAQGHRRRHGRVSTRGRRGRARSSVRRSTVRTASGCAVRRQLDDRRAQGRPQRDYARNRPSSA